MAGTYATPAAVLVISILLPVLGTIAVVLRFYSRLEAKNRLWFDDWLIVPALLLEYVLAALLIWGAVTGSLGELLPPPDVPGAEGYLFSDSDQQIRLQQIQYFFDFVGVFTFGFLKLSILFFYRRIFCTRVHRSVFEVVTTIMIALVIVWTITFGIGAIFLCGGHPTFAWAPVAVVAQKCSAQLPFLEGYAISDFIMDVLIWSLPIPKTWALNMSIRRKLAVTAVFLVGILAIAASATRMTIYIIYIVNAFAQSDGETLITYLLFWTMVESGLGVIVICLPTLRSFYSKISPGYIVSRIKSALTVWSLPSGARTEPQSERLDSLDHPGKLSSLYTNRHGQDGIVTTHITVSHDVERQVEPSKNVD